MYERKTKWPSIEGGPELHGEWRCNYPSLEEHREMVERQFEAEESEGMMIRMSVRDALREFGEELNIASTGMEAQSAKKFATTLGTMT